MSKSTILTTAIVCGIAAVSSFWMMQQIRADERARYRRDVTVLACVAVAKIAELDVSDEACARAGAEVLANH